MTTVPSQELSRPPSPNVPEPRYLTYSTASVATTPVIDLQDDGGDSGDADMSLPEEAPSEIRYVSSPHGFTTLPASLLSDSDNSINIPVRQVVNRILATADFDDLSPLHQPRDR